MPLFKSKSDSAMMKEGKPSLALAFGMQRNKKKKMAEGGVVTPDADSADEALKKASHRYLNQEEQQKALRADAPLASLYNPKKMARGGEVVPADFMEDEERAESIAQAIMQKRRRFAEGGEVDLKGNSEEEPNYYDDLNEMAAGKEQFDDDQLSSQPEDSNEMGDMREEDSENHMDMVSRIRAKLRAKNGM